MDQAFHLEPHRMALQDYMRVMWSTQSRRLVVNSIAVSFMGALAFRGALDWMDVAIPGVVYLLIFLVLVPLTLWLHYATIRARYSAKGNEALYITRYVTLEEKNLAITLETGFKSLVPYTTIFRALALPDYYLVYTSALQILIFPKIIFKDDADRKFREAVGLSPTK